MHAPHRSWPLALMALAVLLALPATAAAADLHATPATLSSVLASSANGDTILLASGSYGTWAGTSKAVTIKADTGAAPTMQFSFDSNDGNFTLDGMGGMGGNIIGSHDLTIKNSTFTSPTQITGTNMNVLLDGNHYDWNAVGGSNAKIRVDNGSGAFSGVTVQNSTFKNGELDGIHLGAGINILNNEFSNLCDIGSNHTDNIQFEGGTGGRIAGNSVHATCTTQGITSYDSNTHGVTIEDNVVDIRRPWGIEIYSDDSSIIRHNTVVWHADADCEYTGIECGHIALDRKAADPAGHGTQVYDNIATSVDIGNGSTVARNDHNISGQNVTYVGPTTTWAGFQLVSGSVGKGAASDGLDVGIRVSGSPPPPPTDTDGDGFPDSSDACLTVPGVAPDGCPAPPPVTDHTPVARFTAAPETSNPGQAVAFDATDSTCEDTPCTYTWVDDGPDGPGGSQWPLGNGRTLSFTFQGTGVKSVRVTVADADGDTDTTLHAITVTTPPVTPPPTDNPPPPPPDDPAPPTGDNTPPDTTIVSGPSGTTTDTTPTFTFTSTESDPAFECRVDTGPWMDCTSPWTPVALSSGDHTVSVRSTDVAGNTDQSPATRTFTVAGAPPTLTLRLGTPAVQPLADSLSAGSAEAFAATASGSGSVSQLSVYVDSGTTVPTIVAGIYSDDNGHPGTLLTNGTVTGLTALAWNDVSLPRASLESGQRYWIGLLGVGDGTLRFRDGVGFGCHSEVSRSTGLTTLPAAWQTGSVWASCDVSANARG